MLDGIPRPEIDARDVLMYLLLMLICAAAFTIIGTLGPMLIHQTSPTEDYIEVTEFRAENVTTADEEQYIILRRSVDYPTRGNVLLHLVLVHNETERHVVTYTETNYFAEGDRTLLITRPLPNGLSEGSYYYRLHIQFSVEGVDRELSERSNTFYVTEPPPSNETVTPAATNTTTTATS